MAIENFKLSPLKDAKFVKANLATFVHDGKDRSWEIVDAFDSVSILIYHEENKSFILVKQFRPAVYMNNKDGMTIELCAGIVDKNLTLKEIAKEEIEEECGYLVPLENIEKVTSFHTAVGFAGSSQTLYYAIVNDSMKVSEGGGIEDENIEVVELSVDDAKEFIYNEDIVRTSGLMFALTWWFQKVNL